MVFLDILGQEGTYFYGKNGQMPITHPLGLLNYLSSLRLALKIVLTFDVQNARPFLWNIEHCGFCMAAFKWHLFYWAFQRWFVKVVSAWWWVFYGTIILMPVAVLGFGGSKCILQEKEKRVGQVEQWGGRTPMGAVEESVDGTLLWTDGPWCLEVPCSS